MLQSRLLLLLPLALLAGAEAGGGWLAQQAAAAAAAEEEGGDGALKAVRQRPLAAALQPQPLPPQPVAAVAGVLAARSAGGQMVAPLPAAAERIVRHILQKQL